jgi:hypothetical protein
MLTKQDHALYAELSQRPDTKQQAIMGISACSRLMSAFKYIAIDFQLLLDFVDFVDFVDSSEGERSSVVGRESSRSEPLRLCAAGGIFTIFVFDGWRNGIT